MLGVNLNLGDCREIIPTIGPVDVVITDPVWPNMPPGMFDTENPADLLRQALELVEAKRVIVVLRLDSDPRFLSAVPSRWPFFRVQTLEYAVPGYIGRKLGGLELAYCFGEPVKSAPGRRVIPGRGPIVTHRTPDNGHPCPRSLEHMRWLVNWHSEPGEIILDPFMGSGTTGAACVEMSRRFEGIEIDPTYYAIAEATMKRARMAPLLWEVE